MTLLPTDKSKEIIKTFEELWSKIKGLIRSTANNSDDYDEKYMKIKFISGDDLPLNKRLELHSVIIVLRSAFHEGNEYYHQVFLDECLYKL